MTPTLTYMIQFVEQQIDGDWKTKTEYVKYVDLWFEINSRYINNTMFIHSVTPVMN